MNQERQRIFLRAVILLIIAILVLFIGVKWIEKTEQQKYTEHRGFGTDEFMNANVVTAEGKRYRKIPAVTTILFGGIDKDPDIVYGLSNAKYRNGGQADFLLLLVIDHSNHQIRQLQIDRDTMAEMTILSIYGKETGTRVQQICLAHNYGANSHENARYTIKSVRNLMDDIEIDGYYMMNYSGVAILNDTLGGVTVTIPDDLTSVNPLWEKGITITLKGTEAETFVRTRQSIGAGTNRERMQRQNEFMKKAIAQLRYHLSQNSAFGNQFLAALKQNAVTNLSDQQLLEEMQSALNYEIQPVTYLEGEYVIGSDGYMEFHASENSARQWILNNLYKPTDVS